MTTNEDSNLVTVNDTPFNPITAGDNTKDELFGDEKPWVQRHDYLLSKGYQLRPRYRPGWKPSWKGNIASSKHEDDIPLSVLGRIMDAERISDHTFVMLKTLQADSTEVQITSLLSSKAMQDDRNNHCVPLLDLIDDPLDPEKCIMIIPLLRDSREPPFSSVGDCVEFVQQTLEGIAFLHKHDVAHRDCFIGNILMDARALYPNGWHPQDPTRTRTGTYMSESFVPKRRSVGGVRYYFIDFGISSHGENEVTGNRGQLRAPELSDTVPYDPYKVDIWLLGQSYNHMVTEKFKDVDWIKPLIDAMTHDDPAARPGINDCIKQFDGIKGKITPFIRAKRLHPKKPEWKPLELSRDVAYVLSERIWAFKLRKKPLKPFTPTEKSSAASPSVVIAEESTADIPGPLEVTPGPAGPPIA